MTLIFAHRGASRDCPENTMSAFKKAYELGADGIELDVQLSKDNVPVIIHDPTLNRTTNGKGKVRNKTVSELKFLDAGSWFSSAYQSERIPTLDEFLKWAKPKDLIVNIELKIDKEDRLLIEKVHEVITFHRMDNRVIISSFSREALLKIKKINPVYKIGFIYKRSWKSEPWLTAIEMQLDAVHPHYKNVTRKYMKSMHKHNIKVRPYTINHEKVMKKLMRWNVDSIITDDPETALLLRDGLHEKFIKKVLLAVKGSFFKT